MPEIIRLNIGCGNNKIAGYINIDSAAGVKPDLICDIKKGLPYADNSIDEIVMFHVIEHIEEKFHSAVLIEFYRVLKYDSSLYISYPEFQHVANNYITNYKGLRDFWKNTIYGLQRYEGDYHVALMDTAIFVELLAEIGFGDIRYIAEVDENYNTVVRAIKKTQPKTYEQIIGEAIFK